MDDGLIGNIFGDGGFSSAIWPAKNDINGFFEKRQLHKFFYGFTIAFFRPIPIKISKGFKAANACAFKSTIKATLRTLIFFPLKQLGHPALMPSLIPVR